MLKLSKTMGKGKRHKEFREHKMVEDFNTDRDIFKGHSKSYMFKADREFKKVLETTFEFKEDEKFGRLINNNSFNDRDANGIDEEFAEIFHTTTIKLQEVDEFDLLFAGL